MQWRQLRQKSEALEKNPLLIDEISDEIRRAKRIKSVESYTESAPQMILQLYIILKRRCQLECDDNHGKSLAQIHNNDT